MRRTGTGGPKVRPREAGTAAGAFVATGEGASVTFTANWGFSWSGHRVVGTGQEARLSESRVEVLLLDADGVVQYNDDFRPRMTALLQGKTTLGELLDVESTAMTGHVDLTAAIAGFLSERGITSTAQDLFDVWGAILPLPGVLELVDRVRAAGVRVFLATNQQPVRGLFIQENLGYARHFDGEFYSFELGLAKPDPAFFVRICQDLDVEPQQALFVDDQQTNVDGARQAGLRAALLPRQPPGPGERVGPAAGAAALEALIVANGVVPTPAPGTD